LYTFTHFETQVSIKESGFFKFQYILNAIRKTAKQIVTYKVSLFLIYVIITISALFIGRHTSDL